MKKLEQAVSDLNHLILTGNTIEAMETFYADEVTMQENEEAPRCGKTACIEHEKLNLSRVTELRSRLLKQVIDPIQGLVINEWEIEFTTKMNKRFLLKEISIQEWINGKVQKEKFYYKESVLTERIES